MCRPGADLLTICVLEIHLDAAKIDDNAEYRLAVVLQELQPLADEPIRTTYNLLDLWFKGNLLFTRCSYHLASPATSPVVQQDLKKFLAGSLTKKEKACLPYAINSTEKTVVTALLGLRGVEHVVIEGKGKMEGYFAATLKATLIQPTGTEIQEVSDAMLLHSATEEHEDDRIFPETYTQGVEEDVHRTYPVRNISSKYDFSSLKEKDYELIDEKYQLLRDLLSLSEYDLDFKDVVAQPTELGNRQPMKKFCVGTVEDTKTQTKSKKQKHSQEVVKLRIADMVQVKARQQDVEDVGIGGVERVRLGRSTRSRLVFDSDW